MKFIGYCLLPIALILGCATVPATRISFNPKTKALDIRSPKDVTIKSVEVTGNGTNFTLTVLGYESKNNIAVVAAVMKARLDELQTSVKGAQGLIGAAIDAAK